MNRINIYTISLAFSIFALIICFHSLFFSSDTSIKTQSIYWFCIAFVSALIPHLDKVTASFKSIKIGDFEIAMNEVREEINQVYNKVNKLDNKLFTTLNQVQQNEQNISEEARKIRQKNYDSWTINILSKMDEKKKMITQESLTITHLKREGFEVRQIKSMLEQLGYYHGDVDQKFDLELVEAVEKFQKENVLGEPDGIAGSITISKIAELLQGKLLIHNSKVE